MFKAIAVSSIAAVATANLTFLQSENVAVEVTDAAWPKVNVPFSFAADVTCLTYDPVTKKTSPYMDMVLHEKISSELNKERVDGTFTIPELGNTSFQQSFDFTTSIFIEYLPIIGLCKKYQIPFQINAKDMFTKILDPTSGITTYLGEQTLPYAAGNKFAFKMTPPTTLVKS